jgi:hypothetical protein
VKIKISLINDYGSPEKQVRAVTTRNLWITEGDDLYDDLVEFLKRKLKELDEEEVNYQS